MTQIGSDWSWLVTAIALNGAAGYVFFRLFRRLDLKSIVSEKAGLQAGADPRQDTSSARVISFFGGMVMTFLVWAMANVLVFKGMNGATEQEITAFLTPVNGFLVSGLTLFAPYLINQAADTLKTRTKVLSDATVEQARIENTPAKPAPALPAPGALSTAVQEAVAEIDAEAAAGTLDASKAKQIVSSLGGKLTANQH